MGTQIVKQPNGSYALFSSIVDDFVMVDATRDEVLRYFTDEITRETVRNVNTKIDILELGGSPYFQFTKTFDECIKTIRDLHGNDTESLRALNLVDPTEGGEA